MMTLLRLFFGLFLLSNADGFAPPRPQSSALTTATFHYSGSDSSLAAKTKVMEKVDETCTIQILMSDTGGGHRASANALRDAFDVLYPGKIQCDIVDIFTDYGNLWPYTDYPAIYKILAKYSFLWDIFYHFGATPFGLWFNEVMMDLICFASFKDCLARPSGSSSTRADMVISVHPLCQDIPLKALAYLDTNGRDRDLAQRTTPFVTVVTDLGGAHPTWFNPGVDKCFVPTDVLYKCAEDRRLDTSQIVQYGLPIRSGFWSTTSLPKNKPPARSEQTKEKLRAQLGLETDLPTVLVVGGGDGMGGLVNIAKSLGSTLGAKSDTPSFQMVVVCGNNLEAKESLTREVWGDGVNVNIQGFVNNMDEWMRASDSLVTKAGPGTIAEASICGLPCMLFAYLPGQEEGNVPFVEESGFGAYSADPEVIADTVCSWLASSKKLESLQTAALTAARPKATLDIAEDIASMLFATKREQGTDTKAASA